MTHATAIALLMLSAWVQSSPEREIAAWSVLRGVPVAVALAVAETETGNVPAHRRDSVVSRGNIGRFQVNATFWCPVLSMPRAACVRMLQDRHVNISVGIAILSRMQAKYGHADLTRCACGGRHAWVGHYNAGTLVQAGSRGERYALKVWRKVERMTQGDRRW